MSAPPTGILSRSGPPGSAPEASAAAGVDSTTAAPVLRALPSNRQKLMKCFDCGGFGHRSVDCPSRRSVAKAGPEAPVPRQPLESKGKDGNAGARLHCYRCRQRGHVKADCPSLLMSGHVAASAQLVLHTAEDADAAAPERSAKPGSGSGRGSDTVAAGERTQVEEQLRAWIKVNGPLSPQRLQFSPWYVQ